MSGARIWIVMFLLFLWLGLLAATYRRDQRLTVKGLMQTNRDLPSLYKNAFSEEGMQVLGRADILLLTLAGGQLVLTVLAGIGMLSREALRALS